LAQVHDSAAAGADARREQRHGHVRPENPRRRDRFEVVAVIRARIGDLDVRHQVLSGTGEEWVVMVNTSALSQVVPHLGCVARMMSSARGLKLCSATKIILSIS
jgi:uncharacterized protein (DUF849 family)